MKRLALLGMTVLLALSLPLDARGQASFKIGSRVGLDAGDVGEPFIGADVRIGLPNSRIAINPTFDYYLVDDPQSLSAFSTNALYRFGVNNQAFTPYSGAGLGVYRSSVDGGGSTTDLGLNTLFGAEFLLGRVQPFVEAQYSPIFSERGTGSLFTVKGGLLLRL